MSETIFQIGDIVRYPGYTTTRFCISAIRGNQADFEPVKKDGTRDRRWYIGFSGWTDGCILLERPKASQEQMGGEA